VIVDSLNPGRDAATDEYTDDLFKAAPMLRRRCLTAIRAATLNLGGSVDMERGCNRRAGGPEANPDALDAGVGPTTIERSSRRYLDADGDRVL